MLFSLSVDYNLLENKGYGLRVFVFKAKFSAKVTIGN